MCVGHCCDDTVHVHVFFFSRDTNFHVKEVTEHDVIHAGPKLIPAIFKVWMIIRYTRNMCRCMYMYSAHVQCIILGPYALIHVCIAAPTCTGTTS